MQRGISLTGFDNIRELYENYRFNCTIMERKTLLLMVLVNIKDPLAYTRTRHDTESEQHPGTRSGRSRSNILLDSHSTWILFGCSVYHFMWS